MKKVSKIFVVILTVLLLAFTCLGLIACNDDPDTIKFTAPEGTPALAMLRLVTDNKTIAGKNMEYGVVNPDNISGEMRDNKSDIIIMPVNAGATLIRQGADYKLVSVAVDGSLYMVGRKDGGNAITFDDIKGKKIACIGQQGVPGLIFRYVMSHNGIGMITEGTPNADQVLVQYVKDGTMAKQALSNGSVDFAVVGEPAATQFKAALSLNAEMNMQAEYARVNPTENGANYPQAGLFVRTSLANDEQFMTALFDALKDSKEWAQANPAAITEFAKANLYESATFPPASIPRCSINCNQLDDNSKDKIITFLKNVMPKDSEGSVIDWDGAKEKIF